MDYNWLDNLAYECHEIAMEKGFYDTTPHVGLQIALIHSELSEMLEEYRKPQVDRDKVTEEAADVLIRLLDMCASRGLSIGAATQAKMTRNRNRPRKHGKAF